MQNRKVLVYLLYNIKINDMPVQFLYTDKEIVKIQRSLLFKNILSNEELNLLDEINKYMKSK